MKRLLGRNGWLARSRKRWTGQAISRRWRSSRLEQLEGRAMLSWTVMVYVDGDNNLEAEAVDDFLEMAQIGSTDDVNIVVQMDRIGGYDTRYDNWTGARRGLVEKWDTPDASWGTDLGEVNMGNLATLQGFVTWSTTNYAADNYALILWNHGGGLSGVCWDDTNGDDNLTLPELAQMADTMPDIDLLGFDACLMSMAEVAYEVRDDFSVMVASEDLEPGDGWEYNYFLDDLVANANLTARELGDAMVAGFQQRYQWSTGVTLSAIDLEAFGSLTSGLVGSLEDFCTTMFSHAVSADWQALSAAMSAAQGFDVYYTSYRDLGGVMTELWNSAQTAEVYLAAQNVLTALDATVTAEFHDNSLDASGLSIYCGSPEDYYNWWSYTTDLSFVADTQWKALLEAADNPPAPSDPSDPSDPGDPGDPVPSGEGPALVDFYAPSETLPYHAVNVVAMFTDASVSDAHTAWIDWGDGSALEELWVTPAAMFPQGTLQVNGYHAYQSLGTFQVSLLIEDSTGNSLPLETSITVKPAILTQDWMNPDVLALHVQGTDAAEHITLSYYSSIDMVVVSIAETGYAEAFTLDPQASVVIWAGGGDDVIDLQATRFYYSATVWGEDGDDLILGGRGNDSLMGGEGNDWIEGFYGDDWIEGNAGNDVLAGYHGNDWILGGDGNDWIQGQQHDDYLEGNAGNDFLTGLHGYDYLLGGSGVDRLAGGLDDDLIRGGAGDDFLFGQEGNDILVGNSGNDRLYGHDGHDLLLGGLDSDLIMGHAGDDLLVGGVSAHDGMDTDEAEYVGYDVEDAALMEILSLWTAEDTLEARIAAIQSLPDGLHKDVNCIDDAAADDMRGSVGRDWFIAFAGDILQKNLYDVVS